MSGSSSPENKLEVILYIIGARNLVLHNAADLTVDLRCTSLWNKIKKRTNFVSYKPAYSTYIWNETFTYTFERQEGITNGQPGQLEHIVVAIKAKINSSLVRVGEAHVYLDVEDLLAEHNMKIWCKITPNPKKDVRCTADGSLFLAIEKVLTEQEQRNKERSFSIRLDSAIKAGVAKFKKNAKEFSIYPTKPELRRSNSPAYLRRSQVHDPMAISASPKILDSWSSASTGQTSTSCPVSSFMASAKTKRFDMQALNDGFQWVVEGLIEMEKKNGAETDANYIASLKHLTSIANEFVYTAEAYGRIIISEAYLPVEQKTIKPRQHIGGVKYVVHNILFKFALDDKGMFGSDSNAAKVAGHELKSLVAYYNCRIENLSLPLMCLLDYKGFRLVAVSVLPIETRTLVYGSSDCGVTVKELDPQDYDSDDDEVEASADSPTLFDDIDDIENEPNTLNSSTPEQSTSAYSIPTSLSAPIPSSSSRPVSQGSMDSPYAEVNIKGNPEKLPVPRSASDGVFEPKPRNKRKTSPPKPLAKKQVMRERVLSSLKQAAQRLNLVPHKCYPKVGTLKQMAEGVTVYGPVDLEIHCSKKDNRYYLVDFSRTFPPETPMPPHKFGHLYRLLRPEFVRNYHEPLCSDAFSSFIAKDPDASGVEDPKAEKMRLQYNDDITEATEYLKSKTISNVIQDLFEMIVELRWAGGKSEPIEGNAEATVLMEAGPTWWSTSSLTLMMHRRGINMRYLGLVYEMLDKAKERRLSRRVSLSKAVANTKAEDLGLLMDHDDSDTMYDESMHLCLIEMCSRAIKDLINEALRKEMKGLQLASDEPFKELIAQHLNMIMGYTKVSREYWDAKIRDTVLEKFGAYCEPLKNPAPANSGSFKKNSKVLGWTRLPTNSPGLFSSLATVLPSRDFMKFVTNFNSPNFPSMRVMLVERISTLLGLHIDPTAFKELVANESDFSYIRSLDLLGSGVRLKHMSIVEYAQGYVFLKEAQNSKKPIQMLMKALKQFKMGLETNPYDKHLLIGYAQTLQAITTLTKDHNFFLSPALQQADKHFSLAIKADPADTNSMLLYAQFLKGYGLHDKALQWFLKVVEQDPTNATAYQEIKYLCSLQGTLQGKFDWATKLTFILNILTGKAPDANLNSLQT